MKRKLKRKLEEEEEVEEEESWMVTKLEPRVREMRLERGISKDGWFGFCSWRRDGG